MTSVASQATVPTPERFAIPLSRRYRRVVRLELNEISRPILDRMIADGAASGFAALDKDFGALRTTSEHQYEHLEPWIQWTTVHTGKTFGEHGVFRLGDARDHGHEQTWEALSDQGIESAIIGSMNTYRGRARGGIFFPDPWSKQNDTHPESLRGLWTLISRRVQGHAVSRPTLADALAGAAAALHFRVSPALGARIAAQVAHQRLDPRVSWRLAGHFDEFLGQIFQHALATTSFGFYTLFLNAVAHYQHHHWRHFDRSGFDPSVTCPDCRPEDDPVRFGYRLYDRLVRRIRAQTDDRDTLLVIASGLSQTKHVESEAQGGMNYWRLRDHRGFAARAGLPSARVFPMMSRDWQIVFDEASDPALPLARRRLEAMTVAGERLFMVDRTQPHELFVETAATRRVADDAVILGDNGRELGRFHEAFTRTAVKSGHHVGTGVLWISDPAARELGEVPLASLHGLVLRALGADRRVLAQDARSSS